jgi:ABC-type transport system involved in cytochrome c biogenesis ATPase subunit
MLLAMQHDPEILLLDEPFTNLDEKGIEAFKSIFEHHIENKGGIIIASNDEREKILCQRSITL